ncbi:MAG: DUF2244 domain-containing protein [Pseudomonadota bacterium]
MRRDIEKREWLLRRNCALTPRQTALAYGLLCLLSFGVATLFLLLGVWQVLFFTVLEMTAVAAAFLYYARHAADYEYIVLTRGCLLVERVSAGKVRQTFLDPGRTRVAVPERSRDLIALEARGVRLEVGCYAMDAKRRQCARELQGALQDGMFD